MGSMPNMLRSLLVIMALVAGLVAIVPRVSEVRQPPVDAAAVAGYTVKSTGTPFLFPSEVPAGWVATNARYAASTDSLPTLQAGGRRRMGSTFRLRRLWGRRPIGLHWRRIRAKTRVWCRSLGSRGRIGWMNDGSRV